MYNNFKVVKEAQTYADTLEAYGLAHFVSKTLVGQSHKITIHDKGTYYEIVSNKPVTEDILKQLNYRFVLPFLKKDETPPPPSNNFYDYPLQRDLRKQRKKEVERAVKEYKAEELKKRLKEIAEKYKSEGSVALRDEHDVFAQLVSNPYAAYSKLYNAFNDNQAYYKELVKVVLSEYLTNGESMHNEYNKLVKEKKIIVEEKATMLQLLNPNQGKGLNKAKASGMSVSNLKGNWIKETMKVLGALNHGMICQSVKVGSSYDLKIFVPAFNNISIDEKQKLLLSFKRNAKSNTPIKLDILNTLNIIQLFIENDATYKGKVKDTLLGLHTVYQKDLGQNKAVVNIGFLETPDFISITDDDTGDDWVEIIKDQKSLMNGITEQGDTTIGLLAYRQFLNGSNINEYFKFNYWYASYLMHELSNKKQTYVTTNKIETLNKIFRLMNFKSIIENEGFQSVAAAIRKSTVLLQYTPKDKRRFDVQYGLAQQLQNKSKSKDDLVTFIGEFIAKYNSDTARQREKTGKNLRANVKDKELADFFELADQVDAKVLGAMLAAYGFALNKKELEKNNNDDGDLTPSEDDVEE